MEKVGRNGESRKTWKTQATQATQQNNMLFKKKLGGENEKNEHEQKIRWKRRERQKKQW